MQFAIYYINHSMMPTETRYSSIAKLTLKLLITSRKLKPYFQAHMIAMLSSHPLKQVLRHLQASGQLIKWSMQLSQYEKRYLLRIAIKGQVVVDFIVELTPNEELQSQDPALRIEEFSQPLQPSAMIQILHIVGSSNDGSCSAGLVLRSLTTEHMTIEYALRLEFKVSNNVAECKPLLAGLRLTRIIGIKRLNIFSDSQLVV